MKAFFVNSYNRMNGNKHTTYAGIIYVVAKFGCPILSAWFPEHRPQLETTSNYLEGAAVFYGFANAKDGPRGPVGEKVVEDKNKPNAMKNVLIFLTIMLVVGCANLATQMFRTEQSAANLAVTTYVGYTNGLANGTIHVTPPQSNSIKALRLKFGASLKAAEGWRSAYETNAALKPQAQAAIGALVTDSDNLINAINQLEAQ